MSDFRTVERDVAQALEVRPALHEFIEAEVLPGTGIAPRQFWSGLSRIITELGPAHATLLQTRDRLQGQLDQWHARSREHPSPFEEQRDFLRRIGYLAPDADDFTIDTADVDPEIARIAGPQLVVPISNARYALNAANARWGSLYDALYGTDALGTAPPASGSSYDRTRGQRVIDYVRTCLDRYLPLAVGSHAQATAYRLDGQALQVHLGGQRVTPLQRPEQLQGYTPTADPTAPAALLFVHHGLHVEIQIDRQHPIGRQDPAGISDVLIEAALTTIQDFEDSVACVDVEDKVRAYRNWLGLMRGSLSASFEKAGRTLQRRLNPDRRYRSASGRGELVLPGRSLMLVRNVGAHLMSDMVRVNARAVPETFLDALITSAIALHDLRSDGAMRNSRAGSIYIVKPKMHGPDEVALADQLFAVVEQTLELPRHTIKMGVMDEERRTTLNLKACIGAARHRLVFINTGFLDRTGDEIHSTMEAGPVVRKNAIKDARWIRAYEQHNVDVGLRCGLRGRAQIGKGMWTMPDLMHAMLQAKQAHPRAGASTAWVPSPTAASLHALHYHEVDVAAVQQSLLGRAPARLEDLLTPPLLQQSYTREQIDEELRNNAQGILGYTVRWINQGVGCSKVSDLDGVALMEDRATLRISSQHMANWLRHGLCGEAQVLEVLRRMAAIVDTQNAGDPAYEPMGPRFEQSIAFQAACELVFGGHKRANGYVEPVLHEKRLAYKASLRRR